MVLQLATPMQYADCFGSAANVAGEIHDDVVAAARADTYDYEVVNDDEDGS